MIATPDQQPSPHFERETFVELLDDRLPDDQAECVQLHLDQCDQCRDELTNIAGHADWWRETIDVLSQNLSDDTALEVASEALPFEPSSGEPLTSESKRDLESLVPWIQPLMKPGLQGELGRIDDFPVLDIVGQGGMGVVLRGVDPQLGRPVAIKVLAPHLAGVGTARKRFLREARAVAAIVHPSIVPIYGIATTGRLPYIVMPYIAGGNLQQMLDEQGPLGLVEILRVSLQIAEGLSAAHQNGVIHRDIKPANILIEEGNGRSLISDFGVARALDDATLTMSGMISGTPQFMSPEQAEGESVDHRSDLFSLGALMYAIATGRPPFRAEKPLATLRKISESNPAPIQEMNESMPAWLDIIVGQLMQKDRSKRIQTAGEAAGLIREAMMHVRSPTTCPLPRQLRASSPGWLTKLICGAICILTVALVAFGVASFLRQGSDDSVARHASGASSLPDVKTRSPVKPVVQEPAMPKPDSNDAKTPQRWTNESYLDWHGAELRGGLTTLEKELNTISASLGIENDHISTHDSILNTEK